MILVRPNADQRKKPDAWLTRALVEGVYRCYHLADYFVGNVYSAYDLPILFQLDDLRRQFSGNFCPRYNPTELSPCIS